MEADPKQPVDGGAGDGGKFSLRHFNLLCVGEEEIPRKERLGRDGDAPLVPASDGSGDEHDPGIQCAHPFTFGKVLVGTFWILPLAYFIRHIPLVVRSTNAALEQLDDSLEEAARNLGARWFTTFRRVILPIILPGIMAGTLLAFVTAVGEFVSSVMLYTIDNRPISIEIMNQLRMFNLGQAAAYAMYQIILIGVVLLISNRFFGVKAENSL